MIHEVGVPVIRVRPAAIQAAEHIDVHPFHPMAARRIETQCGSSVAEMNQLAVGDDMVIRSFDRITGVSIEEAAIDAGERTFAPSDGR
jgi:hypothetical protein